MKSATTFLCIVIGLICAACLSSCEDTNRNVYAAQDSAVLDMQMSSEILQLPTALITAGHVACSDSNSGPTTEKPVDQDGDGVPVELDCNDHNSYVYPGAYELCDYLDNDCDGETDEEWKVYSGGAYGTQCFATGADGCANEGLWLCGFDRVSLACDAWPATEHYEKCNGLDDDCNGLTDDAWDYLGTACEGQVGSCVFSGIWKCDPYDEEPYCTAVDVTQIDASCDNP